MTMTEKEMNVAISAAALADVVLRFGIGQFWFLVLFRQSRVVELPPLVGPVEQVNKLCFAMIVCNISSFWSIFIFFPPAND